MLIKNKSDDEGFRREKTIETMKANELLKTDDYVLVASGEGGYSFYKVVDDINIVNLNNGLFAIREEDNFRYSKDEVDNFVEELNKKLEDKINSNNQESINKIIEELKLEIKDKANKNHTHKKIEIIDFPEKLSNPYSLIIRQNNSEIIYDGSENKVLTVSTDEHTHNVNDIITNDLKQFSSKDEKIYWNNKEDKGHKHNNLRIINGENIIDYDGTTEKTINIISSNGEFEPHKHSFTDILTDDDHQFLNRELINKWDNKAPIIHKHTEYITEEVMNRELSSKAPVAHEHNLLYYGKNEIDIELSKKSDKTHIHRPLTIRNGSKVIVYNGAEDKEIEIVSSTGIPNKHTHNSEDIDNLYGYSKASNVSPITPENTLNEAIGKLEKALDTKASSTHSHSEYANINHTHNNYVTVNHSHGSNNVTMMTNYSKHISGGAISISDNLNTAIGKLEKNLDDKASISHSHSGYALVSHSHSDYVTSSDVNAALRLKANVEHNHGEYVSKQGNSTITGNLTITGEFYANDNVTAYSDIRLKNNINKLNNCLDNIDKINGYSFEFTKTNKKSIGVIAQELQKIYPELVLEDEKGFLSVKYGNITAILIECIKELKKEINSLKLKVGDSK